jgi:hypothetical protein
MEATRDEKGVRKQVYKRDKGLIPVNGEETEALMNIMKRQFLPETYRKTYKYEDIQEFRAEITSYFDYIADSNNIGAKLIPDIEGFCCYAGICRDTLNDWEHTRNPEFIEVIRAFKNAVASYKKQLALKGKIPPIVFATDFNNNHGYTQKQEINLTTPNMLQPTMSMEEIAEKVKSDVVIDADNE